jgi:hypothetical protein
MSSELKKNLYGSFPEAFETTKNQDWRITRSIQIFSFQNRFDPGELSQIDVLNAKFANFVFTIVEMDYSTNKRFKLLRTF